MIHTVGIVNDLRTASETLRQIIAQTPGYKVVWVVRDGQAAVRAHRETPAQIVLIDLSNPDKNGVQTTAHLMAVQPCSILIVTGSLPASRELVLAAMGKGALDAVEMPSLREPRLVAEFRRRLTMVSRLSGGQGTTLSKPAETLPRAPSAPDSDIFRLIGIGASTGGPQVIASLARVLPADFHAAIVIVMHLDRQFVPGFQQLLQGCCALPVYLAQEGAVPGEGELWIADGSNHLVVRGSGGGKVSLHYVAEPSEAAHRPSIDILFESLAKLSGMARMGVLLTGMGRDGAEGLLRLRREGARTLAQDEASSVVFGMPRAALALGAVSKCTAPDEISQEMIAFALESAVASRSPGREEGLDGRRGPQRAT